MSLIPRRSLIQTPELSSVAEIVAESRQHVAGVIKQTVRNGRRLRILLINTGHFGDAIAGMPAMIAARRTHPTAEIAVLVASPAQHVVNLGGWFDRVIALPSYALKLQSGRQLLRQFRAVFDAIRFRPDLVVSLPPDPEDRLIARLTVAPARIGPVKLHNWTYGRGWTSRTLPWERMPFSTFGQFATVAQAAGFVDPSHPPVTLRKVKLPSAVTSPVTEFLSQPALPGSGPLVLLQICGSRSEKRWRIESFEELAKHIRAKHDARCVVVTGPGEGDAVPEINRRLIEPGLAAHFHNRSIPELVALQQQADAVVTSDSGPGQLAGAVGCRMVYIVHQVLVSFVPPVAGVIAQAGQHVPDVPVAGVKEALDRLLDGRDIPAAPEIPALAEQEMAWAAY